MVTSCCPEVEKPLTMFITLNIRNKILISLSLDFQEQKEKCSLLRDVKNGVI